MSLPWQQTKGKRIGLRKEDLPYGHLHHRIDDIFAPPRSDSSKASSSELSELESPSSELETLPPNKRRKLKSPSTIIKKTRSNQRSPIPQSPHIPATKFTSLNPSTSSTTETKKIPYSSQFAGHDSTDEIEEPFAEHYSSQSKTKIRYRGPPAANIHKTYPAKAKRKSDGGELEKVESTAREGARGFKICDTKPLLSIIKTPEKERSVDAFKVPPVLSSGPRSKRATRGSTEEQRKPAHDRTFRIPRRPPSASDKKSSSPQFVVPQGLASGSPDRGSSRTTDSSQNAQLLDAINLDAIKAKLNVQFDDPTSSAAVSSGPSFEFDIEDGHSSSSLSSVLDVDELDANEIDKDWVESHPPGSPKTTCPICKALVSRMLMEEYSSTGVLSVRQQEKFCKAHKARSAEEIWRDKGYPTIDWHELPRRLQEYNSALSGVLTDTGRSFYRNVLEDQIKSGANRHLQQSILSVDGWRGLNLGYYGTRGARIVMEYIMSNYASRIRQFAGVDKLIAASGVSGFVQAVLAPELAIMLIKDDMQVDEEGSRVILDESFDIGNLLNEEEDEAISDEDAGLEELLGMTT